MAAFEKDSPGASQDTLTGQSGGDSPGPGHRSAQSAAGDRVVRDLISRLNVPTHESSESSQAHEGEARTDMAAAAAPTVHKRPIEDSEVEALNPRELAAFEAAVQKVVDPKLVAAIKSAPNGMIGFLETIAKGGTVGGIDEAAFVTMWNSSADEAWLKDKFRAVMPGDHEWIPSNEIAEVVQKAKADPAGVAWVDLQNELRSTTNTVIFNEAHSKQDASYTYLQGHVGALYLETNGKGIMQTVREAEFHDDLRAAFKGAANLPQAIDMLQAVMVTWMWQGDALSKPLHPDLRDSVNKPIDEAALTANRKQVYGTIVQKFADIRAKFAGKVPTGR